MGGLTCVQKSGKYRVTISALLVINRESTKTEVDSFPLNRDGDESPSGGLMSYCVCKESPKFREVNPSLSRLF